MVCRTLPLCRPLPFGVFAASTAMHNSPSLSKPVQVRYLFVIVSAKQAATKDETRGSLDSYISHPILSSEALSSARCCRVSAAAPLYNLGPISLCAGKGADLWMFSRLLRLATIRFISVRIRHRIFSLFQTRPGPQRRYDNNQRDFLLQP